MLPQHDYVKVRMHLSNEKERFIFYFSTLERQSCKFIPTSSWKNNIVTTLSHQVLIYHDFIRFVKACFRVHLQFALLLMVVNE